jgi:predicted DNA-binding transcriptional regulator AlpA
VTGEECLWNIKDVGLFLGVPVATIYQWRVRGEGPPATKLGKHLRYEPAVVRAWVSEQREGA